MKEREPIQPFSSSQKWVLIGFTAFIALLVADYQRMKGVEASAIGVFETNPKLNQEQDCIVPDWAIAMGHEEKYRRRHCGH